MPILSGVIGSAYFFIILILFTLKSELNTFNYLKCKCFNDISLLILIGTIKDSFCSFCTSNKLNTLANLVHRFYFLRILIEVLLLSSIFIELAMTYDRLCLVQNKKNWFTTRMKIVNFYIISLALSLFIHIPYFFAFEIKMSDNTYYILETTSFVTDIFYQIWFNLGVILKAVFGIVVLTIVNAMTYIYCLRFLEQKKLNAKSEERKNFDQKSHSNCTKTIFYLNILYVIYRILILIGGILAAVDYYRGVQYNPNTDAYNYIYFILIQIIFGLNCLCICYFNKPIRKRLSDIRYLSIHGQTSVSGSRTS